MIMPSGEVSCCSTTAGGAEMALGDLVSLVMEALPMNSDESFQSCC